MVAGSNPVGLVLVMTPKTRLSAGLFCFYGALQSDAAKGNRRGCVVAGRPSRPRSIRKAASASETCRPAGRCPVQNGDTDDPKDSEDLVGRATEVIDHVCQHRASDRLILEATSLVRETYGRQERMSSSGREPTRPSVERQDLASKGITFKN